MPLRASAIALAFALLLAAPACAPSRLREQDPPLPAQLRGAEDRPLPAQLRGTEDRPRPARVRVLPVAFVPADQRAPDPALLERFTAHLRWAQRRYRELLGGVTFELADAAPQVIRGAWPLTVYRSLKDDAAQITSELLAHYETDRFRCPYVFAILFVNPCENHPAGGGRPLNGGLNRGGGILQISSWGLTGETGFQSTLRHELGHSFGLCHVDVYGYDMASSPSLMSYNLAHTTRGLHPSDTPGELIPEDRWALAQNQLAFPGLTFDPLRDQPPAYARRANVELGPMEIPGQARWQSAGSTPAPPLSAPRAGYELFLDGVRAGHAPDWTRAQGLQNLRENRARYPTRRVQARYDGVPLRGE